MILVLLNYCIEHATRAQMLNTNMDSPFETRLRSTFVEDYSRLPREILMMVSAQRISVFHLRTCLESRL